LSGENAARFRRRGVTALRAKRARPARSLSAGGCSRPFACRWPSAIGTRIPSTAA